MGGCIVDCVNNIYTNIYYIFTHTHRHTQHTNADTIIWKNVLIKIEFCNTLKTRSWLCKWVPGITHLDIFALAALLKSWMCFNVHIKAHLLGVSFIMLYFSQKNLCFSFPTRNRCENIIYVGISYFSHFLDTSFYRHFSVSEYSSEWFVLLILTIW